MSVDIHSQKILILDFGSQYTQLIARRVREIGVYCEIHPWDMAGADVKAFAPKGIILSGGPESTTGDDAPRAPSDVFDLGCPVLGICYGMQTMAAQLGGSVELSHEREFGHADLTLRAASPLLKAIEDATNDAGEALLHVWMSHGDRVDSLPAGFEIIASSDNAPIAAMADEARRFYGVQFHPEVTHTLQGGRILSHFVMDICGCEGLWTSGNIIEDSIRHVRKQVGEEEVVLGLSGGVDSSVVAALLHEAIGDRLTCIFVDHGLLRKEEGKQVMATFNQHMGIRVIHVDARDIFMAGLKGVTDPEQKRKIIGKLFIDVFEAEAAKLKNATWLAQGTIYPDVIESGSSKHGKAHVIKSHHNVGGLPEDFSLKLLEPLRELFKDEVRKIGLELGLPYEMLYRHPFPGPGLALRVIGEIKEAFLDILREADAIFLEVLRQRDWYDKVGQAFVVFMPIKSVGVTGDARHYDYVVTLRAVETIDFMTARFAHIPFDVLQEASNRIINEVKGISRVCYDISGKPPATIEWE